MDFTTQTTWILIITALAVQGDECPHEDPQARSMTCIKDLPSVKYKPVDTRHTTTDATGPMNTRRTKRQVYNETEVVLAPSRDVPPPSTPDMTSEFINYFCSEYGVEMVHCAKELIEKCSDHPSMREALFNPEQALKAQSVCGKYLTPDFNTTVECVNKSMSSDSVMKCVFMAYSRNMRAEKGVASQTKMCRATAETYNCFVQVIGTTCGRENVGFIVAVMRSMEPRECRHIVDTMYADPVQWTSSSLQTSTMSGLLMLTTLLIRLILL